MKKILYISNIAGSKAKVNFFGTALRSAKRLGMDFFVVANRSASTPEQIAADEKKYGVHLLHADISRSPISLSNIKAYKQICEIIKKYDIDYIHCNTPVGGALGRLAGKKCGVEKVIYQAHGFHFYKGAPKKNWILYYPIERLLARFTDTIIVINKEDYKQAKKFHLRKNGNVYYVPGVGIDLTEYQTSNSCREKKRLELGFSKDDLVIISVGELNQNKNNAVIISALEIINDPHIHYILCGVGDEKDQLQNLAHESGLDNNIHFLGYRSDVKELYAASDIFVMPSFREGLSRSIMEAMASGLPCIVSEIRGNVDLVQNGKGGFLCNPHSSEEFAEAIKKCDSKMREKCKICNLDAVKKCNIHAVEKEIANIYKNEFRME